MGRSYRGRRAPVQTLDPISGGKRAVFPTRKASPPLCPRAGLQADTHEGRKPEEKEADSQREGSITGAPQSHPRYVCITSQTLRHDFQRKPKGEQNKMLEANTPIPQNKQTVRPSHPSMSEMRRCHGNGQTHGIQGRRGRGERSQIRCGRERNSPTQTQGTEGKSPQWPLAAG